MTTSFPFLKIARDYGVPYGEVIRMVENIEAIPDYKYLVNWERAVVAAFLTESYRRIAALEDRPIVSSPKVAK
jgi:hypothetical protein